MVESKWEEPAIEDEFKNSDKYCLREEREFLQAAKYWNPQLFVENSLNEPKQHIHFKIKKEAITHFESDEKTNCFVKKQNENIDDLLSTKFTYWIYEYRKIRGYFFAKFELNFFPLDVQDLRIIVASFKTDKHVKLVKNKKKPSMINSKTIIDQNIW